jgi:lysine-ketoglutarate reductase/saccharopine dehydrogenase-like protein (TIGR00300 family)
MASTIGNARTGPFVEDVEVRGHIIDSLILPKILDCVEERGGAYRIQDIVIGHTSKEPSFARIEIAAPTSESLAEILATIHDHGAVPVSARDCALVPADMDGAFPESFYSTTNQRTEIRLDGHWVPVADQEMDCAIVVDQDHKSARCLPMTDVQRGDPVVVGHAGVRVLPDAADKGRDGFHFMGSAVSTEKPKRVTVRHIARQLFDNRLSRRKNVVVGGPAIVHTGSGEYLGHLIRHGYVDLLLAGNALATHDIEQALYGTSLGVYLDQGLPAETGHEHHLRAINRIRRTGGIRPAVEQGVLKSGIMYECVRKNVPFQLSGSIRDDGPLPEVVTDTLSAQRQMRDLLRDAAFCLMIATTLHSVAVGNLLPAWVKVVCVDINPSTVIKLSDRGSWQTMGLVTDVEPFLRSLVHELSVLEAED